jgi:protein ImuA
MLSFGLAPLDAALGGGLRLGALHEIVGGEEGEAAATLFLAGLLARLEGPVLWVARTRDIFAPGLANAGLHPDRVLYVQAPNEKAVLAVLEEGLRHGGLVAVVGETQRLGLTASRRLQLAAETTGTLALVLRRRAGSKTEPNAALTRWRVSALPSAPLAAPGVAGLGPARWHLALERCRGGEAQSFIVEVCDAKGRLGLSAPVGDGSIAPAEPRAAVG